MPLAAVVHRRAVVGQRQSTRRARRPPIPPCGVDLGGPRGATRPAARSGACCCGNNAVPNRPRDAARPTSRSPPASTDERTCQPELASATPRTPAACPAGTCTTPSGAKRFARAARSSPPRPSTIASIARVLERADVVAGLGHPGRERRQECAPQLGVDVDLRDAPARSRRGRRRRAAQRAVQHERHRSRRRSPQALEVERDRHGRDPVHVADGDRERVDAGRSTNSAACSGRSSRRARRRRSCPRRRRARRARPRPRRRRRARARRPRG